MSGSPSTGTQLKLRGLVLAAAKHSESLKAAQWLAELFANNNHGRCCIEDVYSLGMSPKALGNAAGCVFTGDQWQPEAFRTTERPEARARIIRVWRLR